MRILNVINLQNIHIREAQPKDASDLVKLHFRSVHGIEIGVYSKEILDAWSPVPDKKRFSWMKSRIEDGNSLVLVAEIGKAAVVGFSILSPETGFIFALYVSPDLGRKGIGRELLMATEKAAVNIGVNEIKLNSSLNAMAFYQYFGYRIIQPSKQSLGNGFEMDCYEMRKHL